MLTRPLDGLRRSDGAVGLGCVGMSAEYNTAGIDDDRSLAVLARAVELGVTLFDTADAYGPFTNEHLVGRGLRGHGSDVVIATKAGLVMDGLDARRRADPAHIRASCEGSLRRLGIGSIDL
jgi:aryl-alcohol dehydrogenase-like predicted oxidoreductase